MRFVFMSDTHTKLDQVAVPDGDVLIHAGDATFRGRTEEVIKFNEVMKKLPHGIKLFTPGNHDIVFETNLPRALAHTPDFKTVINETVTVDGLNIWMSPYSPRFMRWAFMKEIGEEMKAIWELIPDNTDIMVIHGPPYGFLDKTIRNFEHVGCEELTKAIYRINPKLVVCGHIHEGYGCRTMKNGTVVLNVSCCNELYQPINQPVVMDRSEIV